MELVVSDNLEYIKKLENNSINFIYFDPPFSITEASYDKSLNWKELWVEMWRVLKVCGVIAIHSSQPFTFDLVSSQRNHFKYCWYWNKHNKTGHLFSKKQPLRCVEEICIFYKYNKYYPQTTLKDKPRITNNTPGLYYSKTQNKKYICKYNYPNHLLDYPRRKHKNGYSTRPDELCEYIIKTYTDNNDLVLDLTCSDGQGGKACKKLGRRYIGVDISPQMIMDARNNIM